MTVTQTRTPRPGMTLAALSVSAMVVAVLASLIVPALATLRADLHTTEAGATWIFTSYLLASAAATPIIGRIGDMHGRKRVLVWTLIVVAVGTLLSAATGLLAVVIVGRVLQGTAGGIFPLAFGIVRDEFPPARLAGGIGLLSAILGIGSGLGIVAGGLILQHLSWHWLFWFSLISVIIAAIVTWGFVPESSSHVPGRLNVSSGLLMAAGVSLVLLSVSESTSWGWGSAKTIGLLLGGLAVCGVWVWAETLANEPLVDMAMMRIRGVWSTNLAGFLIGAGMYSAFAIIPQFVQLPRSTGFGFGASVLVASLYLLPLAILMFPASLIAAPMSARYGSRANLIAGAIISAGAMVLLAVAHDHPIDFLVASGLLGVGIGLAFAALGTLIVHAVPAHQTGVASGTNTVTRQIGGATGAQVAGILVAAHTIHGIPAVTGFVNSFVLDAALLAIAVLAALAVPRLGRRDSLPAQHPPATPAVKAA